MKVFNAYTSTGEAITVEGREELRMQARIFLLHRLADALGLSSGAYRAATWGYDRRTDAGFVAACGALVNAARKQDRHVRAR